MKEPWRLEVKQFFFAKHVCPLSGYLLFYVPFMDFSGEDYSNSHDAVGLTASLQPPTSTLYHWYAEITPDEEEVASVKKKYEAYVKQ